MSRGGRVSDERGQTLPIVALFLVVLLGFAALTIDVGNVLLHKRRLQAAVDLASLSAAQKLPDTAAARTEADAFTRTNWSTRTTLPVDPAATTGCMVAGCSVPDKLSIDATAAVPTYFAKLFGLDSMTVRAKASACGPCETTVKKFDVMVVLDRSYSMCLDSRNGFNGCYDLKQAVDGIKSLLKFFDPVNDQVGLTLLSSADTASPTAGLGTPPCDTADPSDPNRGQGPFFASAGDFMDGTPSDHDSWVVAPLSRTFKNDDGSLNDSSPIMSTLDCVKSKYWTPIAPAISEATNALVTTGRSDSSVTKVMVFLGDGGANVQPMRRDGGTATATRSWYTPTDGNDLMPCHDAVAQAAKAKAAGIEVFSIGYDLNASSANTCFRDNHPNNGSYVEPGITAKETMQQIATDVGHFYGKATPGELYAIFNSIGHQITTGGTRLVE